MIMQDFSLREYFFLLNNKYIKYFFLLVLCFFLYITPVQAQVLGLDPNGTYDIYVGGGQSLSVIKNVKIVELRDIQGRSFLVIRTDTFNAPTSEGLITFDYIRAIIPSYKTFLQDLSRGN